ncbi:MBL fold metallo-hydrolase [Spirochaetia bacterium]|nr:MBL fold metallo-hydrolase [Spirochaetia bacterium]
MMKIIFHGVRGSHTAARKEMMKYGGNTLCVEIVKKNKNGIMVPLVIDGGTGIIDLGRSLIVKIADRGYSATFPILFTHYHTDHIEGFKFFKPLFLKTCMLHLFGMQTEDKTVESILQQSIESPIFPLEFHDFKASCKPHSVKDGDVFYISQDGNPTWHKKDPLYEIHVMRAYVPSHPKQGVLYYKIIDCEDGVSVACVWDIESHSGGDSRVINFIHGSDVLIHDTQYTDEEYWSRAVPTQGFGHSTYSMAIENAREAHVRYLIPIHYSPSHDDAFLDGVYEQNAGKHPFGFIMSREGLTLKAVKEK